MVCSDSAAAGDVWPWGGKPGVDGVADRGDGRGKNVSGGQRLSPVIGIALLLLAVLWLAHPAWLLSSIGV